MANAMGFEPDVTVRTRDYRIGCIGAGMIMAECHLAAYKEAGFSVAAIASRTRANAERVAERWGIAKVHDTPEALIEDTDIDIVDLAFPPDLQPALIRHALKQKHIKAILAQKPLALSLDEAIKLRDEAAKAGKILSVNQNMRYDQSMRVLKQIIESGALGDIVFAQIDMHAIPHWQPFLQDYDRLTLSNMSVHHLDVLRFLFGDAEEITTLTRKDPRTTFDHFDGITVSTIKFPSGVLALSLEDVWSGPAPGRLPGRPAYQLACRRHRRRREGHDRLADGCRIDACPTPPPSRPAANGFRPAGTRCGFRTPSSA